MGICKHNSKSFLLVDLPGTYSLMSNSTEEEIARNYICFGKSDCTIVVIDATCLERNLNLVYQTIEIANNVVVCVNLLDEANKKGIKVNLELLEKKLGVPVVGTIARKKKTLKNLMDRVYQVCKKGKKQNSVHVQHLYPDIVEKCISILESNIPDIKLNKRWVSLKLLENNSSIIGEIEKNIGINLHTPTLQKKMSEANSLLSDSGINSSDFKDIVVSSILSRAESVCSDVVSFSETPYRNLDRKIDKILTSKVFGFPIMLLLFGIIFWLTIVGANYPSQALSYLFGFFEEKLLYFFSTINAPDWLSGILVSGMYKTLSWVVAVMLPPMAIFFPLFTILEDLGYLPRISFNLDNFFKKACTSGKQALTMCMGFGCNAAGVIGARIFDSPREKLIAILTNVFVPCNRKISFSNYY